MEAHPKLKPVDTPTRGVYIAGCAEAPKDIKDSVTQASASAARAEVLLSAPQIAVEAITAVVDEDLCKQCGECARVCPFSAIAWERKQTASVISAACAGCGTCAAECRFDAIAMRHFTDQQIYAMVDAILDEDPADGRHPAYNTVIFACHWCSYAGADTAGTARLQYPSNGYIIRTMCSGRVKPDFVWYAFQRGAPLVLVSGCHYADCHYINANRNAVRRVDALWEGLEHHGVDPRRLQLDWCSAAEGQKWARIMRELEDLRAGVTDDEIQVAREVLKGQRVPRRSEVWRLKGPTPAQMICYRCGNQWEGIFDPTADRERMCPTCRSNSVRVVPDGRE